MLKITIQVKEKEENKIHVGIKKISEKEFNSASQLEKITASEIKAAIEAALMSLKSNMKEGKEL